MASYTPSRSRYRGGTRGPGKTRTPLYSERFQRGVWAVMEANERELLAFEQGVKPERQIEAEAQLRREQQRRWHEYQGTRPAPREGGMDAVGCDAFADWHRAGAALFEAFAQEWRDLEAWWVGRKAQSLAEWAEQADASADVGDAAAPAQAPLRYAPEPDKIPPTATAEPIKVGEEYTIHDGFARPLPGHGLGPVEACGVVVGERKAPTAGGFVWMHWADGPVTPVYVRGGAPAAEEA